MTTLRALLRILRLVALTAYCVPPHLLARRRRPSPWPQRFLGRAARIAGFDVRISGTPLLHDVFYVANHLSWIDILSLGGATGCAFISKDGVQATPVVGWLAAQNNTIFVARKQRGAIAGQVEAVRAAVALHQPIALFPEGTTGDGSTLLPFKPALFEVLLPPPRAIRIQPVVMDYGPAGPMVAWREGESGIANALRVLGAKGRRPLTLHFLAPFDPGDHPDRKTLSAETRARIAAALAREAPAKSAAGHR
ncbi:lysophospholipid acyltransferase family protein [Sphingobium nicotianae]|uniref:1-acyl-sn-glycerol-3-phosphate acyltransferase n=1 Tax=Sphingobium nicotianae TaxID=2782607 RepID=A0A9X1DCT9_9SPHN|nr:lysophospholipid acyltransferase family protein [Sphingobium nicotianae]MBT2187582.1 1-acyl-sn-glycerol-3-phosphate acyltransferase [Sphingobium nicotianae]